MAPHASYPLSSRARHMRASEIRELLKLVDRPGMISFAGGIPDPSLLDHTAFRAAYDAMLADAATGASALQYSATEGYLPLRGWLAERMTTRGIACSAENILVTHGSQQALDLIGKLFLDPGDRVVTQAPTYLGALQSFSAFEPAFANLRHIAAGGPVKLIYLVPDFANPTGRCMELSERIAALDLAERHGAIIAEDAAYTELRYEGEDLPPIAALDQARVGGIEEARTLHCGTFSKTLSPGLRLGWICGPAALIHRLTLIKQASDLHTATANQRAMHAVALSGFDARVARARRIYRQRRDWMLEALERHAPPGVTWTRPRGGLFIWLTLPAGTDAAALLQKALARNIAFVPGGAFFADGSGANTLRLSFSLADEAKSAAGIARLCELIAGEGAHARPEAVSGTGRATTHQHP
ncbi:aminotransferase-like domain-containing protein [Roseomonas marmotae]|uniref:PLP-dependent aminotransferase family protein n=1 Tax=Roseomonas marmotae TaxID=2768161 RepID=A0ABS3KAZ7_9PROT|nr:PLP-dependent aminotransferase family protein [Roseomonas marmotae]MBO1074635.1 PLP-dependent aminotransferase family protein [Roseomonas marmotae]QTI81656.1 PLP-dependent aminotransferase family protein [Roseomonas marmotae]